MIRKIITATLLALLVCLVILATYPLITGNYWVRPGDRYEFDGVSGPNIVTTIATIQATQWQAYDKGTSSRLAIFLTEKNSAWLGLVHGLKTIGVPFLITTDINEALKHNVVLAYPTISGKVLKTSQLKQIADYVRTGGNLIGINVLGGGLQEIFGFKSVKSSLKHHSLQLQNNHPLTSDLDDTDLRSIRLSTQQLDDSAFGTHSYVAPKHAPLAIYNDGTAAIVYNKFSDSKVYAFGFDIGFYLLKAYNLRMGRAAATLQMILSHQLIIFCNYSRPYTCAMNYMPLR